MNSQEQIERGMQLAKECSSKYANDANWHVLRAHLERMTQTVPGGSWSVTPQLGDVYEVVTVSAALAGQVERGVGRLVTKTGDLG